MQCRHCNTGSDETQEHIEICTGFAKDRETLNLNEVTGTLIFWRRVVYKLRCMKLNNKDIFDPKFGVMDSSMSASEDRATMPVYTSVPNKEARTRGREGLRISAGEAFSARDISVGEVTQVTPRSEMLHTG